MITREIKLQPNKKQEEMLLGLLWNLTGVYNWAVRRIELNADNKIYFSKMNFQNSLAGTCEKLEIPSHVIQGTLTQAYIAWERCFKKIAGKPKLKGNRNKFSSIPFPDPIKAPVKNRIKLPLLGSIKFCKQELPEGKIKCGRVIKRADGWYLCLTIDAVHTFPVKQTTEVVGIDPGFSTLLTLSNGLKIENPRELRKGEKRIGQSQRGKNKNLTARLQQKQANRRKDRNHKLSRKLIEDYQTIFYSDDSFKKLATIGHGKSVAEASLGNLIALMNYKSALQADRKVIAVSSVNSTKRCSACGSLSGPSGKDNLAVREWGCGVCGTHHDRDINAAMNALLLGQDMTSNVMAT